MMILLRHKACGGTNPSLAILMGKVIVIAADLWYNSASTGELVFMIDII